MAALSVADRTRVWRALMRHWSRTQTPIPSLTKFDLYDPTANTGAIADTDNWIDTHGGNTTADNVGFNGALATNVRSNLTLAQKTVLFVAVASMRVGVGFLRQVLGEETE